MKNYLFLFIFFINVQANEVFLLSNATVDNHLDLMYPITLHKYEYPCEPISSNIPKNSIFLIDFTKCNSNNYNKIYENIIEKSQNILLSIIKLPIKVEMKKENNIFLFGKDSDWNNIIDIINTYYLEKFEKLFQEHKNNYDNNIKNEKIQKEKIKEKIGADFLDYFFEIITYIGKNSSLSYYESFGKIYKNMLQNSDPDEIKNFINITLSNGICNNSSGKECANYIDLKLKNMNEEYRYTSKLLISSIIENNKKKMLKSIDILMRIRISNDIFLKEK